MSLWPLTGSVGLLAVFAATQSGFGPLWDTLGALFRGHGADIEPAHVPPSVMVPTLAAAVVVKIVVAPAVAVLTTALLPLSGRPATPAASLLSATPVKTGEVPAKSGDGFASLSLRMLTILVILEELYARWLFLGVLPRLFDDNVMFVVLFLVGNGTWALLHVWNHKDRKVIRVVPQFLGGIVLTAVFVRYGLAAAVVVHAAYNMLLWSVRRPADVRGRVSLIVYNAVLAVVAWLFLSKPVGDLGQWFRTDTVSALPGWRFADYFWAVLFVCTALTVLAEILGYVADPAQTTAVFDDWRATIVMVPVAVLVFALASWWSAVALVGLLYLVDVGDRVLRRLDLDHRGYVRDGSRVTWQKG